MIPAIMSRLIILFAGILHPGYASYKAIRTKSVEQYVNWMMYWIIFALYSGLEVVADLLVSWFPFYGELKVALLFWLLPSHSNGSARLYCNIVHPFLLRREHDIDELLKGAQRQGYDVFVGVARRTCTASYRHLTNLVQRFWIGGKVPPIAAPVPIAIEPMYIRRNMSPTHKFVLPIMEQAAKSHVLKLREPDDNVDTNEEELVVEDEFCYTLSPQFNCEENVDALITSSQ